MKNIQQADGVRIIWEAGTQLESVPNEWQHQGLGQFWWEGVWGWSPAAKWNYTGKQNEKKQKQLLQRRIRAEKWKQGVEMKVWQSSKRSRESEMKIFCFQTIN